MSEALAAFRRGELGRARALAQAQLDEERGPPEVNHLLGLIDCREGRLESGVGHLRAAVEAQPDNVAFRVMLARALIDADRAQEALEVAEAPKETGPAALALWHARAEAAQAVADHSTAAEGWHMLCAARPEDWRSWANYGDSLAGLERWDEAAQALRRASMLNPNEVPIKQNFAAALSKAGFHAEAVEELRHMLDTGADDVRSRLTLARLYADLGRNEAAMAEFDRAAQAALGSAESEQTRMIDIAIGKADERGPVGEAEISAVRELALLFERTSRVDPLRELLDDALAIGIAPERLGYPLASIALRDGQPERAKKLLLAEPVHFDPVRWHALMARIGEALGDSALAFSEAEAMHGAVRDLPEWQRKARVYIRRIARLGEAVDADWVRRIKPLKPGPRPSPAFLVGFPRSGTTLLDTFLMGHPETLVVEEQPMLNAAERIAGDYIELPNCSAQQLHLAREAYFTELDRHIEPGFCGVVVDKLPLNMLGLPLIHALFPDARLIFAQRHPCDVVLSGFMQGFALNDAMACFLDIADAADFYDAAMGLFWKTRELLPLAFHTLVYEQLVADPEAALRPAIEFLGLDWRPGVLDHQATARARGAISTPSYTQVVQPLSKAPSGRWRRYEMQLEPVLPRLLRWAEQLGY
jgi:tetratricopeptide (TPR) repeat protein